MTEFSRTYRIDTLGGEPRNVEIKAEHAEREALARRFGLVSVKRLAAEARLARSGTTVTATGRLNGAVIQSCVATGEPVEASVDEEFRIEFHPRRESGAADEEIELSEGELDVVFYDGASVDLGEAVADTLSLALDPYPRSPAAEEALREAGVKSEAEAQAESSPFAGLAALRDKLKP